MKKLLQSNGFVCGILLAFGLISLCMTSCKKETDLMDTTIKIADQNIPATYSYTLVDSTAMTMTVYEYVLQNDLTGKYQIVQTGDGVADSKSVESFTWARGNFTDDLHTIVLYLTYTDTERKDTVLWGSHSIKDSKFVYSDGDKTTPLSTLMEKWPNINWTTVDNTYWTRPYTMYYMNWKQVVGEKMTPEQLDAKNAELAALADTIAWYNAFFKKEGDAVVLDTVQHGNLKNGKYTCIYWKGFTDSIYYANGDTIGYKTITEIKLNTNRGAGKNSGSYYFKKGVYSKEYYTDPTSPLATYSDSTVEAVISVWNYQTIFAAKKFNLMAKGDIKTTVNGVSESKTDWMTFRVSDFVNRDTVFTMTLEEVPFVVR